MVTWGSNSKAGDLLENLRKKLVSGARDVSKNAYAPYSGYHVGAALMTTEGNIFTGTNVENSSYGATICAERGAIMNAVATQGPTMRISAIAVMTSSSPPAAPCGECLQVLVEFAPDEALVFLANQKGEVTTYSLKELLPKAFRQDTLQNRHP
ncbi:cytidine deaminase [Myxococcota bacterium]|nr:cytidine deaminase [Myxococcota bacterium]